MYKIPEPLKQDEPLSTTDALLNLLLKEDISLYKIAYWISNLNNEPFDKVLQRLIVAKDRDLIRKIYGRPAWRITGLTPWY